MSQPKQTPKPPPERQEPLESLETSDQRLKALKKKIISSNPKKKDIPKHIIQLTPSEDAEDIKSFSRISKKIKKQFEDAGHKKFEIIDLEEGGPTGSGPETGKKWHTSIKRYIDTRETNEKIGKAVIDALDKVLKDIKFLQSDFPLYGYMFDEQDSEISLWNGRVDAIGWYQGQYVIVDWKAVNLLDFWEKNKDAYGKYLHQCLVYAQLLQLQLDLSKLPYILIVPICNVTGAQIRPGWFYDFPQKCKDELNKYKWFITEPKRQTLTLSREMVKRRIATSKLIRKKSSGQDELRGTLDELLTALGFEE